MEQVSAVAAETKALSGSLASLEAHCLDQGFSTGASAPVGVHGAVLRRPRPEAFIK